MRRGRGELESAESKSGSDGKQIPPIRLLAAVAAKLFRVRCECHAHDIDIERSAESNRGLVEPQLKRNQWQIEVHAQVRMLGQMFSFPTVIQMRVIKGKAQ